MKKSEPGKRTKRKIVKRNTAIAVIAALAVFSIIAGDRIPEIFMMTGLGSIYNEAENYPLTILFPDVGSAACAVIKTDGQTALIDCERKKAQADISATLTMLGSENLDLAIMTSQGKENITGFSEIVKQKSVSRFVTSAYGETDRKGDINKLYGLLDTAGIPTENVCSGDIFQLGEAEIEVISPMKPHDSERDNAVVLRLTFGDFTALFTGKITSTAEKEIISSEKDISADLLYAAGSGRADTLSAEFLECVSPSVTVIPVEGNNTFPNGNVIKRLSDCGSKIYRTDISGAVAVMTDGNQNSFKISEEKQ